MHNERTFLVHLFGRGLEDDRYVVERYRSLVNGDVRRIEVESPKGGRRRARRATATLRTVKALRPEANEIIVCTGLRIRGGVQLWGSLATGLFAERRYRSAVRW